MALRGSTPRLPAFKEIPPEEAKMTRQQHFERLCAEIGAQWEETGVLWESRAEYKLDPFGEYESDPQVFAPRIGRNELAYYVALHELGHCAHRHKGQSFMEAIIGPSEDTLRKEGQAWLWAFEQAGPPKFKTTLRAAAALLNTYGTDRQTGAEIPEEYAEAYAILTQNGELEPAALSVVAPGLV
jgi:hypothetical protein